MTHCLFDYQATLAGIARRPQDLRPHDAEAVVARGRERFDAIRYRSFLHWILHYTDKPTQEAIRTAYLTHEARSEV